MIAVPDKQIFSKSLGRITVDDFLRRHFPDFREYINEKYQDSTTIQERLYRYYNGIDIVPTCPVCNKRVKFHGFSYGYAKFCGSRCASKSPESRQKVINTVKQRYGDDYKQKFVWKSKETCMRRYGVTNPMKDSVVVNKLKNKFLQTLGVDNPMKNEDVKAKSRQTCLERYGVEYSSQADDVKQKARQTNLLRYGAPCNMSTDEFKEVSRRACLERYGVEYVLQSPVIRQKIADTCLTRYGTEYALQSPDIRQKITDTCHERYGGVGFASQELSSKTKQTCLERYDVDCYSKSQDRKDRLPQIQSKTKHTCFERYGVEHYSQTQDYKDRTYNTKKLNNTFSTSVVEEQFATYLDNQTMSYIRQYKSEVYPFNCDFYLPDYDLYIEIQASWVHGGHPYDAEHDTSILERWRSKHTRYYDTAADTWTRRDVNKRNTAKQHNLNYLEIFSNDINEVIIEFENYININDTK